MNNDAHDYCNAQVRRFDRERWLTALFAPEKARRGLLALYALNVEIARIPDLVREPGAGLIRLQWWREALEELGQGQVRPHPVLQALRGLDIALPLAEFEAALQMREFDLSDEGFADLAALEAYALGTSGALMRLALAVLGGEEFSEPGRKVAVAWTLAGILRAVPFHAARRRLYLPRDLLAQHDVSPEPLFAGRPGAGLAAVAVALSQRAGALLREARAMPVGRAALPALLPATLADAHLTRLARAQHALFDPGLQRPLGSAAARLAWAAWRGKF